VGTHGAKQNDEKVKILAPKPKLVRAQCQPLSLRHIRKTLFPNAISSAIFGFHYELTKYQIQPSIILKDTTKNN
jgi:hypothetical protein